ncbi:MAG: VOC family protein [Chitinivibrionales bacterium]|nr:VOC family protein [Chitinivibrionales bacterium]
MAQKIIPNVWFDNQAEEAAKLYVSIFKNSKVNNISHYGEAGAQVSGKPNGSVMTVEFELAGQKFLALNGGPVFSFTPAISFFISCETAEEVDHLFSELSQKGEILMPLNKYPFSERYAWFRDRYGLSWQVYLGNSWQKITPCLMFIRAQYGKAVEAMRFYTSIFNNSRIENVVSYEKGEGEKEGAVKHARFSLDGMQFIFMDSGLDHQFTVTPAISFMVSCENQKEIDLFWKRLSAVPDAEQCGWLQDKYGVSWQIVPKVLGEMMQDKDYEKTERAMKAMIQMKKIDIDILKQAYEQK